MQNCPVSTLLATWVSSFIVCVQDILKGIDGLEPNHVEGPWKKSLKFETAPDSLIHDRFPFFFQIARQGIFRHLSALAEVYFSMSAFY